MATAAYAEELLGKTPTGKRLADGVNSPVDMVKDKIRRFIMRRCKVWGAAFETELPPEFIITFHAQEKLNERFKCSPEKQKKVVVKAWHSAEELPDEYVSRKRTKHENNNIYKQFCGYIFVFGTRFNDKIGAEQKILVTCYRRKGYQFRPQVLPKLR